LHEQLQNQTVKTLQSQANAFPRTRTGDSPSATNQGLAAAVFANTLAAALGVGTQVVSFEQKFGNSRSGEPFCRQIPAVPKRAAKQEQNKRVPSAFGRDATVTARSPSNLADAL
jgi:hypothetical protein